MSDLFSPALVEAMRSGEADQAAIDPHAFADGEWADFERKYLQPEIIFPRKAIEIAFLGLDRLPPLRLLDLGAGTGHFCLLAQKLGHEAIGLTAPRPPIFVRFAQLVGVPVVAQRLQPRQPLAITGTFDLITASRITFADSWDREEWSAFLKRLRGLLRPSGGLFFSFNYSSPRAARAEASEAKLAQRRIHRELLAGAGLREESPGIFVSAHWPTNELIEPQALPKGIAAA